VVYTLRGETIRVISARDMTRQERLPEALIENLKMLANKRDVPYQSLLKIFLAERIEEELRHSR